MTIHRGPIWVRRTLSYKDGQGQYSMTASLVGATLEASANPPIRRTDNPFTTVHVQRPAPVSPFPTLHCRAHRVSPPSSTAPAAASSPDHNFIPSTLSIRPGYLLNPPPQAPDQQLIWTRGKRWSIIVVVRLPSILCIIGLLALIDCSRPLLRDRLRPRTPLSDGRPSPDPPFPRSSSATPTPGSGKKHV